MLTGIDSDSNEKYRRSVSDDERGISHQDIEYMTGVSFPPIMPKLENHR